MICIGKSGARSSGPTGCPVPGWSTGGGGAGRSAAMLYQASGRRLSSRTYFTWSDISRSSPSLAVPGVLPIRERSVDRLGSADREHARAPPSIATRRSSGGARGWRSSSPSCASAPRSSRPAAARRRRAAPLAREAHRARADRPPRRPRHGVPRAERARRLGAATTATRRRPGSSPESASSRAASA